MKTHTNTLTKASNLLLWRGILLIAFGLLAFFWAGLTLWALILTFGFFAVVDGLLLIVMYFYHRATWGRSTIWLGIISLLVGLCALFFSGVTALLFATFFCVRAFFGGIIEIRMATHLRKHMPGEILLITNGILSILFAFIMLIILLIQPVFGLLIVVEIIGLYALCLGILMTVLSSHVKSTGNNLSVMI